MGLINLILSALSQPPKNGDRIKLTWLQSNNPFEENAYIGDVGIVHDMRKDRSFSLHCGNHWVIIGCRRGEKQAYYRWKSVSD